MTRIGDLSGGELRRLELLQAADRRAEPARPRRADQRPGRRDAGRHRGRARLVAGDPGGGQPRPLLPGADLRRPVRPARGRPAAPPAARGRGVPGAAVLGQSAACGRPAPGRPDDGGVGRRLAVRVSGRRVAGRRRSGRASAGAAGVGSRCRSLALTGAAAHAARKDLARVETRHGPDRGPARGPARPDGRRRTPTTSDC